MGEFDQAHALQAFSENKKALVRHFDHFMHDRQGPDGIQVGWLRRVNARFALRDHHDGLVFPKRINELNRTLTAHGQGKDGVRKKYGVSNRQYR